MAFSLRFFGRIVGVAVCLLSFAGPGVLAQSTNQQKLLPDRFAGWTVTGDPTTGTVAAQVDSANADVLNEFGLKDFAESTYRRGNGKLTLRAMRFQDATGAYGAYTFYRTPGMKAEAIGGGGAGDPHATLFWSGPTLVDATFDPPVANSDPSLSALAASLPSTGGSTGVAPTLPEYLPQRSLEGTTIRYAIGPQAYVRGGGVLPPGVIGFSRDAEVVTAHYAAQSGDGTLTLIEYPTPQMAIGSEQTLSALVKGPLPASLQNGSASAFAVHRSGPLVAVTSGNFSSAEAQALLSQVKYQADVTWNRANVLGNGNEVKNAAKMLIGIAYLTLIVAGCALFVGGFLGGGRALWRKMRGKPASSVYEEEFISLNLSGSPGEFLRKLH
jgi:hypothetical protein